MSEIPESILAKIREAKEKQLKELDLSWKRGNRIYKRLFQIPIEVFELTQLEVLNLGGNRLTTVQDMISQLENLTSLNLSNNQLTDVPDTIAQLQNLTSLGLSGNKLMYVPDAITQLQNLTSLGLSYNQLTTIPNSITKLKSLKTLSVSWEQSTPLPDWVKELPELRLNLSGDKWATVPGWVFQLQNLTSLGLSYNQLTTLPDAIGQLQNLTSLGLSYNQLTTLPDAIGQLQNLTSLNLRGNQLTTLSDAIGQLRNLVSLDLEDNQLIVLPDSIGQLKNLASLHLAGNKLITLPNTITQLQNLISLGLGFNKFTSIPDPIYSIFSLQYLEFDKTSGFGLQIFLTNTDDSNQIKEISPKILQLKNLKTLGLKDNPIEIPPPEVVKKGVDAIKEYFRQLEATGKDYLYEAKLLIVGEGGAGKTTLAKKIEDAAYQLREDEGSTRGIEVIRWEFPLPSDLTGFQNLSGLDHDKTFRVNIWDFGGQEIYHATHQFFLTKRSLYALVADTRKEDTDFYYWLNIVELLSDNSPLLIVLNEKQDRHREINERQLRGQFTNLKETLATNLATNRGLAEILSQIRHYISHLPHIGVELPKTWVRVREALENDPRDHISLAEYLDICRQNGFDQAKDSLQLSGYLHDLGVCLHFQADPLLKKTVILKPEWGTAAVYKVLDDKTVIRNLGRFSRADLETIWHEPHYATMQDELLQLMINFKLCYRIPGSCDYIAPQLLSANQPHYGWPAANNLLLRYTYEFMPKGILTQFIVAMQALIANQRYVWKNGVILRKDKTAAEVIEHYDRREVSIRIAGQHKKELLTIVTYELDKIHAGYRRLKVNKLIPCNCPACKNSQEPQFYPFEVLQKFTEARQEQIQCQKGFQMVNVWGLIDDVLDRRRVLSDERERFFESEHLMGRKEAIAAKAEPSVEGDKEIFISYAWGGQSEEIVNRLEAAFQTRGVTIVRDKKDLKYKGRIKEFMERIGRGKAVLVVISDKYLKSENCMFELVQIAENGQFYDRIFPIVLADAGIYKSVDLLNHIKYWEDQIETLNKKMKMLKSQADLSGIREDIDLFTKIRATIATLTNILKDMNTLTPEMHTGSDFEELFETVERKMAEG